MFMFSTGWAGIETHKGWVENLTGADSSAATMYRPGGTSSRYRPPVTVTAVVTTPCIGANSTVAPATGPVKHSVVTGGGFFGGFPGQAITETLPSTCTVGGADQTNARIRTRTRTTGRRQVTNTERDPSLQGTERRDQRRPVES